jgi:hypothetical protein
MVTPPAMRIAAAEEIRACFIVVLFAASPSEEVRGVGFRDRDQDEDEDDGR